MRIEAVNLNNTIPVQENNKVRNNEFENMVKNYLDKVNDVQINADTEALNMLKGDADIHEVMIATEEARLSLELTVQLRNKMIDAYQEIMRIQI
ncbi:flagellar hook-basal body complex protein FliE [Caloramator quimbayensis]|uniref:Flagellar hook-basal body complex protein FliE n=1 Tax=Caloramator quimbayensis TaxID=1147123 RepID=A0A1T4X9R2_9CLOT|nr:flagellar hook-basal body complex protein FliE [Caloramator quimbayensis]SKA86326.1 flagellar hook-basal body complex protein FliE [Caloramator quimbayensis]